MVEITHKGLWVKWSSMDSGDRFWFVVSMLAATPLILVAGIAVGRWSYRLGYYHGAGKHGPDPLAPVMLSEAFRYGVIAAFVLGLISGFAWWRFSLRQDELFNRIQNDALGRTGAWSLAAALAWWTLAIGGWVGPFPLDLFVVGSLALSLVFWLAAVRRCT